MKIRTFSTITLIALCSVSLWSQTHTEVTLEDNQTLTGTKTFNAQVTTPNLNNTFVVDGTVYANVQAAITAATVGGRGSIVDARGCSLAGCLALGTLDVGNVTNPAPAVTVLLGPYQYTATQIILRRGFGLLGMKNGDAGGTGTTITATSASTPLIIGPNHGTDQPAQHWLLENIRFVGANASTADGMFLDTIGIGAGGLGGSWYSQVRNCVFDSFGGIGIHLRGSGAGGTAGFGVNQWISFYDVTVFRTNAGGSAVNIEGANYQIFFYGGEYDGYLGNAGIDASATPNVYVGCRNCGTLFGAQPYIVEFHGPTIQGAATLVQIDGAANVVFSHPHHEQGYIAYLVSAPSSTFSDHNVSVLHASFNGNVGVNSGNGYLMKVTAAKAMGISVRDSFFLGNGTVPDNYFGNTGGAPITCCDFTGNEVNTGAGWWSSKPIPNINNVGRLGFFNGTALTTGAFAFAGNWGTSPILNSVRGTDSAFILNFTSGSGSPGANPQIQVTFVDGTWGTVPACIPVMSSGGFNVWVVDGSSTATLLKLNFVGTPGTSTTYTVTVICGELVN